MVARIVRVPLREVWKHEAPRLHKMVGREHRRAERRRRPQSRLRLNGNRTLGDFSVDLVAEDDNGNPIVIENQLEKSNHEHLGKLVTYLTAVGARTAIWIVSDPRPEHVNAITWLNESNAASFYLVKVEAIRIGLSEPAPLLTLIVGPSEEGREVGETKKEIAERFEIRRRFWTGLLEYAALSEKLLTTDLR